MSVVRGRRVYPNEDGWFKLEPGDYGQDGDGAWWACAPVEGQHYSGVLTDHQVTEHPDGTITVSPSLMFSDKYHGFLERGWWRPV